MKISIRSYGFVQPEAFGGIARPFTSLPSSPFDLEALLPSLHPRFERLDILSQYVIVAVALAGLNQMDTPEYRNNMGIILGTDSGSQNVDLDFGHSYTASGVGSPKLFPFTLPSIAIGELSIRYGIRGPSSCFMAGPQSGSVALREACAWITSGEVDSCLCLEASAYRLESIPSAHQDALGIKHHPNYASAVVLESAEPESRASLCHLDSTLEPDLLTHKRPIQSICMKLSAAIK